MSTNIETWHKHAFEALKSGQCENLALMSCFVGGEPAAAIVAVNRDGEEYRLTPMFVSVTGGMVLTDHDGVAAAVPDKPGGEQAPDEAE